MARTSTQKLIYFSSRRQFRMFVGLSSKRRSLPVGKGAAIFRRQQAGDHRRAIKDPTA
jgi:hypothetical protein